MCIFDNYSIFKCGLIICFAINKRLVAVERIELIAYLLANLIYICLSAGCYHLIWRAWVFVRDSKRAERGTVAPNGDGYGSVDPPISIVSSGRSLPTEKKLQQREGTNTARQQTTMESGNPNGDENSEKEVAGGPT